MNSCVELNNLIKMEKFIKYLENQKRLSVQLGTPQGEIEVLEAIIKEAKKQLRIGSVSQQREHMD
jgi:hypothetical protein